MALIDHYTLRARLFPMFVLLLPVGFTAIAFLPSTSIVSALTSLFGTLSCQTVLAALLAEIGRDVGKKREPMLFALWGGPPSSRILSQSSTPLDAVTVARYRARLGGLLPELRFPSAESEASDPTAALAVYQSCTNYLRERTRDKKAFPVLYSENVSYGFRRNLWAVRPAGLFLAVVGLVLSAVAASGRSDPRGIELLVATGSCLLNAILLVWWVLRITPDWVRLVADEYAKRLYAACEVLK